VSHVVTQIRASASKGAQALVCESSICAYTCLVVRGTRHGHPSSPAWCPDESCSQRIMQSCSQRSCSHAVMQSTIMQSCSQRSCSHAVMQSTIMQSCSHAVNDHAVMQSCSQRCSHAVMQNESCSQRSKQQCMMKWKEPPAYTSSFIYKARTQTHIWSLRMPSSMQ
jgi:hypothetical protein